VKSFVINLDSRPDKWAAVARDLRGRGLSPERFPALGATEGAAYQELAAAPMQGGARGLIASFLTLLGQVEGLADEWVLVFEDDARPLRRFEVQRLERILRSAPAGTALVHFGYLTGSEWRREFSIGRNLHRFLRPRHRLRALRARSRSRTREVLLRTPQRFTAGTQAMAVRPSAVAVIVHHLAPYDQPLDYLVHRAMVAAPGVFLQTTKSLVSQRAHRSDITSR
jgi:GR25 family glycosyltransferase involved in LPS biosynthesis